MKNLVSLLFSILIISSLHAQTELSIKEMNSDNDARIEISGEDPAAADFMRMLIGFNNSSDAWIRTITNNDLSFWTNNTKRVNINSGGSVQINDLAGTGTRPVYTYSDGTLTHNSPIQTMVVTPPNFLKGTQTDITIWNNQIFVENSLLPSFFQANATCSPMISASKYRLRTVRFFFKDDEDNENFNFDIVRSGAEAGESTTLAIVKPAVNQSSGKVWNHNLNALIDQSVGESLSIIVRFPHSSTSFNRDEMFFYKVLVKYEIIE